MAHFQARVIHMILVRVMVFVIASLFAWLAAYFFVFRDATGFEDFVFLGWLAVVSSVVVLLPELLFIIPRFRKRWNGQFLAMLGAAIAIPILLSWLGAFGWYTTWLGYDSFVHFASSAFGVLIAFQVLLLFGVRMEERPLLFGVLMLVVVLGGAINELFEYYGDLWWGTAMYGEAGQSDDTLRDIGFNTIGGVLGFILCLWRGEALERSFRSSSN